MPFRLKNVKAARKVINEKERDVIVFRNTVSGQGFGGRIPNDRFVPIEINSPYLASALQSGDLIEEGSGSGNDTVSSSVQEDAEPLTQMDE